jgi:hypothetical protein
MQSRPSLIIQYIFLVILIASNHLFSQDIQKIKQSDTVYIYFKKDRITIHNQQKPLEKYIYTFTYFSKDNIFIKPYGFDTMTCDLTKLLLNEEIF